MLVNTDKTHELGVSRESNIKNVGRGGGHLARSPDALRESRRKVYVGAKDGNPVRGAARKPMTIRRYNKPTEYNILGKRGGGSIIIRTLYRTITAARAS